MGFIYFLYSQQGKEFGTCMKKYVLGVDGGGTKTHCALYDMETGKIDLLELGPTNHENLLGGYEELRIILGRMLNDILTRSDATFDDLQMCVFGMGGVDTRKQHENISTIIRGFGINNFILCNDAFLGIKAGCRNGYGICAINGSGFSVAGIDPNGKMLQIGGQGQYTGDKGGGYYLVPAAVRSVYNYLFKGSDKTLMVDVLFNELGVTSKYDFMDIITEKLQNNQKEYYQRISKILYETANYGDKIALQILQKTGEEYAKCIGAILRELDFKSKNKIEIILAGSQFVRGENPRTKERIIEMLKITNSSIDIDIKLLHYPCVTGALLWALEGIGDGEILYKRIIEKWEAYNV